MKVVHINTYDGNGGAGRACLRLSKALMNQGVESGIWVYYKFGKHPQTNSFSDTFIQKTIAAAGILLERYTSATFTKRLKIPFSIPLWGRDISAHRALQDADIIHIHWINHGFLRPKDLAKLQKLTKPIVWTFHDNNAFTGGCHVRYGCDHFENECGNCPILIRSHPKDISHKIWLAKQKAYQQIQFSVVTPSHWMGAAAKRSKLLGTNDINVIPNTLETDVFKPCKKDRAKEFLNIAPRKFVMLSGFMPSKKDLHKGTPYLVAAIDALVSKNLVDKDNIELVVFGNKDEKNVPEFSIKTTFLGTIVDDEKLALCYSAADVFVAPSLEDNLPNTVMESLACGTPVVAFDISGLPDLITHQGNGYLARYKSSEDLANGIAWVLNHPDRATLQKEARRTVEEKFSEAVVANKHLELYKKLLFPPLQPSEKQSSLSVITVVYNNARDIERTIKSVINQTYRDIEYIIIDGGSTDGTLEIIGKYKDEINKLISEKDEGIYDAMNKGLAQATGDYVLFMNSGDEIYAPDTVERVFSTAGADVYYGETEMFDDSWNSLGQRRHQAPKRLTRESFRYGMSVSHQAIYVRRELAVPYNVHYKLSSDIDWILNILKKANRVVNTNMYVAKYLVGGMSKKSHRASLAERFLIFSNHFGLVANIVNHIIMGVRLLSYFFRHGKTND